MAIQNSNVRTYNNRERFNRNRQQALNLTKDFKSFEDGYMELTKLVPDIRVYGGETAIYEAVIGNILDTLRNNVPSTTNPNYPNTFSFSIDSHEFGLRTDAGMAFGLRTYYDRDAGEVVYRFRVTFISVPTHRKIIAEKMVDEGWTTFEVNQNQSRFWNRIERRSRNFTPAAEQPVEEAAQSEPKEIKVEEEFSVTAEVASTVEVKEDAAAAETPENIDSNTNETTDQVEQQ